MVLDTSAILAVIFEESDAERLAKVMAAGEPSVGAPTITESGIVLGSRLGFSQRGALFRFLQEFLVTVLPFGDDHWREAVDAYERFGKGRHRAALNFGDCMSYATAKVARLPLLCVGDDFRNTDLPLVTY